MPAIKRFPGCKVLLNPNDHNPPHFHVRMNDGREAWVAIATLEILHGGVSRREIAEVLTWAAGCRAALLKQFEELQQ